MEPQVIASLISRLSALMTSLITGTCLTPQLYCQPRLSRAAFRVLDADGDGAITVLTGPGRPCLSVATMSLSTSMSM